jgi:hypothetical protein
MITDFLKQDNLYMIGWARNIAKCFQIFHFRDVFLNLCDKPKDFRVENEEVTKDAMLIQ